MFTVILPPVPGLGRFCSNPPRANFNVGITLSPSHSARGRGRVALLLMLLRMFRLRPHLLLLPELRPKCFRGHEPFTTYGMTISKGQQQQMLAKFVIVSDAGKVRQ